MRSPSAPGATDSFDVAVVGAGFGGLGCALRLAERGLRVAVRERIGYPGGCAGTFERAGYRFEAGATLFSGFAEGQLFRRWIDEHGLDVEVDWLDPVIEFRTPGWTLDVPPDRERLVQRFLDMPDAPVDGVRAFFEEQGRVADALWGVLDDPALLPPLGPGALLRHLRRAPRYLPLARLAGTPLGTVLRRHGLEGFRPLTAFADAMCRITVQCGAAEAEAPFAMATMDYPFRGTAHVRNGIGALADGLVGAVRGLGGDVRFADAVQRIERDGEGFLVTTRKGRLRARRVVANVLPGVLARLLGEDIASVPRLARLDGAVKQGWGAAMLYLVAREPDGASRSARHVQIVQQTEEPYVEGNHLFCSISGADDRGRAPPGRRTLTVSTHVPMPRFSRLPEDEQGAYIAEVQERMRAGLAALLPDWWAGVEYEASASPRTFERFTGRPGGYVGGVPRRAGLGNYTGLVPSPVVPGVSLVGDSVFPGQSTLATALGGHRVAEAVAAALL